MKIKYLTDELIELYSQDNVLTESRDFNLHYDTVTPYPGGVYDSEIFGSVFSNQCNCGRIRNTVGVTCPRCKSTILDPVQAFRRFARIELPVYYCSDLKLGNLVKFLLTRFRFQYRILSKHFESKLTERNLNLLQFNYLADGVIEVTDDITDISKCSYEGLLAIISQHNPKWLAEFNAYINTNILVLPLVMRPPYYTNLSGSKELNNENLTTIYKNILYATQNVYKDHYMKLPTEFMKAMFRGNLRKFISKSVSNISRLLASSKQNYARNMQDSQMTNSGRCTIIPDPSLKIDEVCIPTHLIYECCREEFQQFLMDKLEISESKAESMYKYSANSAQVQDLFREYIEGDPNDLNTAKYVFILRNPTLHELNIMMLRVRLTNDYCMKLPMAICKPFNADFDGDTMAFFAVPKKSNETFAETMSPRNLIYYKKNHAPLFTPTHEMMQGLILATKVKLPTEVLEFDSIEEAKSYKKKHRDFTWQTLFKLNGTETTLGREILSDLFCKNLNDYLGEDHLSKSLNAKNVIPLYSNLADLEDRTDRIQKIQEFSLNVVTMSGATAPTLSQLYTDVDSELLDKIHAIEANQELSEVTKAIKVNELYGDYVKEQESKFDDSIKLMLNESSRAKVSQLLNMVLPQLSVGPDGKAHISHSRLIGGMTPTDYARMAIENRAVQDIKVDAVPNGGYLTRQFAFLAMGYQFSDTLDENNQGIEMEMREAVGRTLLNGDIIKPNNSSEVVKVRSIVSSNINGMTITRDMIPIQFKYKDGARIGISMMTSLTEGLTQAGLALKHGGSLFQMEPNGELRATKNCKVEVDGSFIKIQSNKLEVLPKPDNFILSYSENNEYKVGEVIGGTLKMNSPAYKLDSIISLCSAKRVTPKKKFARNKVLMTDCYATNSGIIHYKEDHKGNIHVLIDNEEYQYNPNAMYLFPEGSVVKKYDRICSGTLSLPALIARENDYFEVFKYFKLQFRELNSGITSELIEFLYTLIVTQNNNKLKLQSVTNVIYNSKSFYTAIAFSNARKKFKEITPKGTEFISDTMTQVMLSLITNNEII